MTGRLRGGTKRSSADASAPASTACPDRNESCEYDLLVRASKFRTRVVFSTGFVACRAKARSGAVGGSLTVARAMGMPATEAVLANLRRF